MQSHCSQHREESAPEGIRGRSSYLDAASASDRDGLSVSSWANCSSSVVKQFSLGVMDLSFVPRVERTTANMWHQPVPAGSTAAKQLKLTLRIHIARYALVIATLLARHAFLWNSRKWRSFSPGGSERTQFRLMGVIVQWTAHVIIHSTDIHVTTSPHM